MSEIKLSSAKQRMIVCTFGLFVLTIYILTLYPTIAGGDSAELTAVAIGLGVPHPPGYPLYALLGKLFSLIPIGSVAWRLNLMSAFFQTSAAIIIYLALARWTKNILAALLAAALFAFSPLIWAYAVSSEVFSLNNFFCAGLVYLLVLSEEKPSPKIAYFSAFFLALGLCNHHLLAFFGFPFAIAMIYLNRNDLLNFKSFLKLIGCFLLGLIPYLYLPIAASLHPKFSWGETNTLEGFLNHFFRTDFGTLQLGADDSTGSTEVISALGYYVAELFKQTLYAGLIVGLIGAWMTYKQSKQRALTWFLLSSFFLYLVVFHGLSNFSLADPLYYGVQARFWQQPNIVFFIWIGIGTAWLLNKWALKRSALIVLSVGIVTQVLVNFKDSDQHSNFAFWQYGKAILEPLPPRAVLLVRGDLSTTITRYLQTVENVRQDVQIVPISMLGRSWMQTMIKEKHPDLVFPGHLSIGAFLEANLEIFPIFICDETFKSDSMKIFKEHYRLIPRGIMEQVVKSDFHVDPVAFDRSKREALTAIDSIKIENSESDFWSRELDKYLSTDKARFGQSLNFVN